MSNTDIGRVLAEIRAAQTRTTAHPRRLHEPAPPLEFSSLLKNSIDKVAEMQNKAQSLSVAYESGDKSVDLTKVMLEVQKAGLAFRAMTEVRNKLVDAYREVMSMPV
jgi:flagellar hook-basal body complex protein FliE